MRRIICVGGAFLLVSLGLAACGGGERDAVPAEDLSPAANDVSAVPDEPDASLEDERVEGARVESPVDEPDAAYGSEAMTEETRMEVLQNGIRMETDEATVTIQSGGSAVLPEDFPADVALLEGMELTSVMNQTGEQEAVLITAEVPMSIEEAAQAIADNAKDHGWTEVTSVNQAGAMAIRTYEKAGRSWSATVLNEDGKTLMNWAVSK